MSKQYKRVDETEYLKSMSWDTPRSEQGQIVQTSYSTGHPGREPAGPGDRYMRVVDGSDGSVEYYQRAS